MVSVELAAELMVPHPRLAGRVLGSPEDVYASELGFSGLLCGEQTQAAA